MRVLGIQAKNTFQRQRNNTSSHLMRPLIPRPSRPGIPYPAVLLAFFLWALWVPDAVAGTIGERLAGSPKVPWQISADNVAYDAATTTYHATGQVIIEKQATRLIADRVDFNHKAMTAVAEGHVVLTVDKDVLTGQRMELNIAQETGVVTGGSLFFEQNHFYIRGQRIEKTGRETYRVENGSVTTCDGDRPDWIITSRTLKVTVEGYGQASHAVLRARDLPVLYVPYIVFPAKTRRQTGLLIPEVELSDRKGFAWNQPLFWAIDDSSDATLYTNYMEERGTKIGLEYRYARTDDSYGVLMADGLRDRKIDDGTEDATEKWGYGDDAYDRPNADRYWLRAKVDQELPQRVMARLDLDIVSDQDYLTEFREGPDGFNATRDYFLEAFGRDLDTYDENTRTNRLNLSRSWSRFSFNADMLWNDNVTNRRWEETDDTLQRLPRIEFDGTKQQAFESPFYWDLASEYTYFYREDGDRGHRTDLYPRAYLPLKWKNYLSVEPSAGWRQTAWVMDRWEDETLDQTTYRQIYDAKLDVSTEFSKIMGSPVAAVDRIRHSVKPRVVYQYIPDQDQSDLPDFDTDIDRIAAANTVTYSLTNTFTARQLKKPPPPGPGAAGNGSKTDEEPLSPLTAAAPGDDPEKETAAPVYDYSRFCRFYLEQTYDIDAAKDDEPEPFSDLYGELDLSFGSYFGLNSDADFDTYAGRFSSHNVAALVNDGRGDRLRIEHRYKRDKNESVYGTVAVKLTERLSVTGEYERDLLAKKDILKGAGFLYNAQCWAFDFRYTNEDGDSSFAFRLNLMGIGGFGN